VFSAMFSVAGSRIRTPRKLGLAVGMSTVSTMTMTMTSPTMTTATMTIPRTLTFHRAAPTLKSTQELCQQTLFNRQTQMQKFYNAYT